MRKRPLRTALGGVNLGPNSPLRDVRLEDPEKVEQARGDRFVRGIGGSVVNQSQARASHVELGLPDRRYRVARFAFFYEMKATDGHLTVEQHAFLMAELDHDCLALCGTADELEAFVRFALDAPHSKRIVYCQMVVERWAAKGYRRTAKKGKGPRRLRG